MDGPRPGREARVLTPAVLAAAAFALAAALVSVAFVSARGGLQLPVAPSSAPDVAVASPSATSGPTPAVPTSTPAASPAPTEIATAAPSPAPTEAVPSAAPTPGATAQPSGPADPLLALPACPDHPGCFEYTVRRGDTYTGVNDRFGLLLWITNALNPEVADKGVIVVGQVLYLGHDPEARLEPCPNGAPCHLYVVRSGDTVLRIATRFGVTVEGILGLNPSLDPNAIGPGLTIRLPLFQG